MEGAIIEPPWLHKSSSGVRIERVSESDRRWFRFHHQDLRYSDVSNCIQYLSHIIETCSHLSLSKLLPLSFLQVCRPYQCNRSL